MSLACGEAVDKYPRAWVDGMGFGGFIPLTVSLITILGHVNFRLLGAP